MVNRCPYGRLYECDGGCYECPPNGTIEREARNNWQDDEADRIWSEIKEMQTNEQFNAVDG